MSTPISNFTARDIAGAYSYSADRVQLLVVDEATVLAIGYREDRTATGRVAWIVADPDNRSWLHTRNGGPFAARKTHRKRLDTLDDDLDALVRWLRGDA